MERNRKARRSLTEEFYLHMEDIEGIEKNINDRLDKCRDVLEGGASSPRCSKDNKEVVDASR